MPSKRTTEHEHLVLKEAPSEYHVGTAKNDFPMLDDSLALTPWERILANDDIVNFGDSLRAAMEKRNAKTKLTRKSQI